jgi:hypothetical protein
MNPMPPSSPREGLPAAVVFVDRAACVWLRPLRRGFRHCFAALRQPDGIWLICDPLKHSIELAAVRPDRDVDLLLTWQEAGHQICIGHTRKHDVTTALPPLPGPLTCVAVVKRLLGLSAPRVLTPYQLHEHLTSALSGRFVVWR